MEYSNGYVAFIDILGFSKYVSEESNGEIINDLFDFVKKFQYLFNYSPKLNVKVAFFSDSIVITTPKEESFQTLLVAIWIAESYLHKNTGLYFRGGITKGLYYHKEDVAFGPAIVNAYRLEKRAIYSRILIDKEKIQMNEPECLITKDFDGEYFFNPYFVSILGNTPDGTDPTLADMFFSMRKERMHLCDAIKNNYCTAVIDKYLWRIIPFNKTCDFLPEICQEYCLDYTNEDVEEWKALKIHISD